ncbi:MAG: HAMP domain-containing sensor histidine kinase [Vicingaceae bacterium]
MNNKKLPFLTVAASLSMVALIAIQVYWIKTSAETQQRRFDQKAMEVMSEVTEKLEREEAITSVTSRLFHDLRKDIPGDSVFTLDQFPLNDPFQKQLIKKQDHKSTQDPTKDLYNIQFEPPQQDSTLFIIRKTQKRVLSSRVNFESQLQNKATLVNEIVNELALISVNYRNFDERVSHQQIDSLFKRELKKSGLNTDYVFDILDAETQYLSFTQDPILGEKLKKSPYRLSLFPNDFTESDSLLLYFPKQQSFLLKNSWEILALSFLLVLILILLFYSSLSTIFKQKQLSQVKNDFINNMTHELKTPISTIGLACEALSDKSISIDPNRRESYVGMINEENKRLSVLVDNVLKSAVWDSAELKLETQPVNLHEIIHRVAENFEIQISKREGNLELELAADNSVIKGDKVHLSNVFYNLLDNANKYSNDKPQVAIISKVKGGQLTIQVKDKGIGISKENQKRIFEKFYRVSTGNLHDVKGFGLGLNYVKRIVELHQGSIDLKSQKGKGTTITLKFDKNGTE